MGETIQTVGWPLVSKRAVEGIRGDDIALGFDGPDDDGAEPHGIGRLRERHLDRIGPGHGIGAGRDLSDGAVDAHARVGLQGDVDRQADRHLGGDLLRHRKDALARAELGDGDDHLPRRHHLAGVGADGRHGAVRVGLEGRIGHLILGQAEVGLRRLQPRLGGVERIQRLIIRPPELYNPVSAGISGAAPEGPPGPRRPGPR